MLGGAYAIPLVILIVLEVLVIIRNVKHRVYDYFFWFCELSPLLLIIGFATSNLQLIKGVINVGLFPQFISFVALSLTALFGIDFDSFGRTILKRGPFYVIVSFLLHVVSVNIGLIYTLGIKANFSSIMYSFLILVFMFVTSIKFTSSKHNVNFAWHFDFLFKIPKRYYVIIWFIVGIVFLVLPTFFIQNWIAPHF